MFTLRQDLSITALVVLFLLALVSLNGDALYIGLWYYIAVPAVAVALASLFRPPALFRAGVTIALAITLLLYLRLNWYAQRPEGLLGLLHLASLPGAAVGVLTGIWVIRRKRFSSIATLLVATGTVLTGFGLNHLLLFGLS